VHFDWKEEAVKEAESSANGGNISKERLLEILVENRKFTQEEAEYAIEHAQVDWLN
ncbi:MAG: Ltp family lipoprotein, partial [Streptococcus parasanguinis]|nr:Ltp family lipoprotein [Streptococcus parasanguinis]